MSIQNKYIGVGHIEDCDDTLVYRGIPTDLNCDPVPDKDEVLDLILTPKSAATYPFTWAEGGVGSEGTFTVSVGADTIDNGDVAKAFQLRGRGNLVITNEEEIEKANGKKQIVDRERTITHEVNIKDPTIYHFLQKLQGGTAHEDFTLEFTDLGGNIFGGVVGGGKGIELTSLTANIPKEVGARSKGFIVAVFNGLAAPNRAPNPLP